MLRTSIHRFVLRDVPARVSVESMVDWRGASERPSYVRAALLGVLIASASSGCSGRVDRASGTGNSATVGTSSGGSGGNAHPGPGDAAVADVVTQSGSGGHAEDAGHPGPCNPFLAHELPVTLGTILGVGKDAQGTLYMADEVASTYTDRVFVSAGDAFYRKRVTGTGSSGGPVDEDFVFTYEAGGPAAVRALLIQRRGGVVTAMALGPSDSRGFIGTPGATDQVLTVLDASTITGMKFRNLPGEVVLEYLADVENGNVIVVTRPRDDMTYASFRLFYGTPNQMLERKVVNVYRGDDTDILFLVGSVQFDVHFAFRIGDSGILGYNGPDTLDTGNGKTLAVTERHVADDAGVLPPGGLSGFSFICIR